MSGTSGTLFFFAGAFLLVAALRVQHHTRMSPTRLLGLAASYGFMGILHSCHHAYRLLAGDVTPDRWLHVLAGVNLVIASIVLFVARSRKKPSPSA
jgi:uncharacterized protein involved in response to NO